MKGIPTRQTLIEQIKSSNDNDCWEKFCESYQGYIFIVIRNMGISFHDSQELQQEVMLKAWEALPNFEYNPEKGKFRWWLCRIVKNTVYNYFLKEERRQKRLDKVELEQSQITLKPEIDKIAEEEWQKYVVNRAWENIQNSFSSDVLYVFNQLSHGKPVRELAEELKVEENTIHVYKSRVQKKLYREIAKIDYELNC